MINTILIWVIPITFGFIIGSIPTGYIISKLWYNDDIRNHGSGNIGSTNITRTFGKNAGKITFIFDVLKTMIAYIVIKYILKTSGNVLLIAEIFILIGHCWSIFLKFNGGKAVASSLALAILSNFWLGLIPSILWNLIFYKTKIVSLASILSFLITSIILLILWIFNIGDTYNLLLIISCSIIIIIRHQTNIKRMINGEEYTFKKEK